MEKHHLLIALSSVIVFGTAAQWISSKLRLPSILLLLGFGFLAGPILHLIHPDEMLGELLFPCVSLCVAVILFEGALSLKISELQQIGRTLLYLLTIGVLITWGLTTLIAYYVLQASFVTSLLLGAILVVTGPTVIGPLLRQIRPVGKVGPIARWEGIVIDPVGAVLAVLVYEANMPVLTEGLQASGWHVAEALLMTIIVGVGLGGIAALILATLLKKHAIPDHLENLVTLLFIILSFTASNVLQEESGLVAVTVMGIAMANSKVKLQHIVEFKESLSLLLISGLFILLSARVEFSAFTELGWRGIAFVALMILVVRPVAVFASTMFSDLKWQEQVLLSWLAPRGIVAAAVASIFAIEMGDQSPELVPATFMLIVATVVIYGLTAFPLAKKLGLASDAPQGVLIVGANDVARAIGHAIQRAGYPVLMVDTNHWNLNRSRMEGLHSVNMNILQESVAESIDLGGIGRLLALTPNDEVNALGAMHFSELFGRANVFQLTPWRQAEKNETTAPKLSARYLFSNEATYDFLRLRLRTGSSVKITKLSAEFNYSHFKELYGDTALPLFISHNHKLTVVSPEAAPTPVEGQTLIALVQAKEKSSAKDQTPVPHPAG